MVTFLRDTLLAMVGFALLDGLWLGLLMTSFYRERLAPIARMSNGALAPNWSAAIVVYVLLGAGIAAFAVARAEHAAAAAAAGDPNAMQGREANHPIRSMPGLTGTRLDGEYQAGINAGDRVFFSNCP